MSAVLTPEIEDMWARHNAAWRDTAQVASQWQDASEVDRRLLECTASGEWWSTLSDLGITLIVGREYEHLLISLSCSEKPAITYMPMPHPSGIVADRSANESKVFVASTRNPNQVFELAPAKNFLQRQDVDAERFDDSPLLPRRSHFLPGCMYIHDLALIDGVLHANAVGENCIVGFDHDFNWKRVWWPGCIEKNGVPDFSRNYIQLNSIAAGASLQSSYFTASSDSIEDIRPGDPLFAVDKRGVLFRGDSRDPVVRGLTRPHSARLDGNERVWLANSGYGEFGSVDGELFNPVCALPGWTRGVAIVGKVAFVATSRVIPKFRSYAPGLDVDRSICGVHAVDLSTGEVLGSLLWPSGNQIFAIDWLPCSATRGLPFPADGTTRDCKTLFYTFATSHSGEGAYDA